MQPPSEWWALTPIIMRQYWPWARWLWLNVIDLIIGAQSQCSCCLLCLMTESRSSSCALIHLPYSGMKEVHWNKCYKDFNRILSYNCTWGETKKFCRRRFSKLLGRSATLNIATLSPRLWNVKCGIIDFKFYVVGIVT